MIEFTASIQQFGSQGEKTGWSYIEIPADLAQKLKPGNKKAFRVKGKLDDHPVKGVSLLPMGGGKFIMAINAGMRKAIHKKKGGMLKVKLEADNKPYELNKEFVECLNDDPAAISYFKTLPKSHQNYFSKWIESAKTIETKAKRIAQAVNGLSKRQGFGEMLRELKKQKGEWG
jgi:hypothetical protein